MEIREDRAGGVLVVAPVGRIDSNTSDAFEKALLEHIAGGQKDVVIDLLGVEYISSAGLRVLLLAANKLRPLSGKLALCSLAKSVREVFELAGLTAVFTIDASRELALARLAGSA